MKLPVTPAGMLVSDEKLTGLSAASIDEFRGYIHDEAGKVVGR